MARFTQPTSGDGSGLPGPQGDPGPAGADGTDALWNFLGEWQNGIDYPAGSVVQFQGSSYYHPDGQYSSYAPPGYGWLLISAKGDAGTDGSDGATGADGDDGADGSPGLVYLGNYVSGNGYVANLAVVKGSDNNLYIATSSGGLGDPVGNTAEWAIFLPKGADGAQGDPGPQGYPGTAGGFGASASYYSTADQGPQTSADTIQAFTYNNTDWQTGVLLQNNSRIKILSAGRYNIAFSAQLYQTNNTANVNIWLSKNGSPVTNTNTKVNLNSNNHYLVAAWNFFVDAAADDYYELIWSSSSTYTSVQYDAAATINGNVHPAIPSIILTVNQVG
jgi:hypothetical protein